MSKSYLTADDDVSDDEVVRVGLNGFGRIGRNVFRAVLESPRIDLVGINDVMDFDDMAYLAKYDTVMGRLDGVARDGDALTIGDTSVPLYNVQDPADLPWDELDVDVALECTGVFPYPRGRERAPRRRRRHRDHLGAPKGEEPVKQLVYGVNHDEYEGDDVISNASCTTNSITPVAKVLDAEFGIDAGTLTTVHAYTGSQSLIDGPKAKTRRGRAGAENIVPTSTGAAGAAQEVLPQLEGKIDGMAMRVPVPSGSITEFVVSLDENVTADEVNAAFRDAADSGPLAGVLGYTDDEVVSSDIVGLPFSSYVDLQSTNVIAGGKLLKILTWYDNEYGFSNRMLDMAAYVQDEA